MTFTNKLYAVLFSLLLAVSCSDDSLTELSPDHPDIDFLTAQFAYVNSIDQYGVPADQWAENSEFTFYYISDSESGKPQGRLIWNYSTDAKPKKAWWRFDAKRNRLAIFGEGGTAGFLVLTDQHREIANNWRALYLNEEGI